MLWTEKGTGSQCVVMAAWVEVCFFFLGGGYMRLVAGPDLLDPFAGNR